MEVRIEEEKEAAKRARLLEIYQELFEENAQLRKELDVYRKSSDRESVGRDLGHVQSRGNVPDGLGVSSAIAHDV